MRRRIFLSGVLVMIAGLALLVSGASQQNIVRAKVAEGANSWEATANLTSNNMYVIDVSSSDDWQVSWTYGGFEDPQPTDMIIVSPDGNVTTLRGFFYTTTAVSPYQSPHPLLVEVQYQSTNSSFLEVDTPDNIHFVSTKIRFRVLKGGNFTCRVVEQTLNWTAGPPLAITFYVEISENKYAFMIPSGGAVCIGGVVVSLFGARAIQKSSAKKSKAKVRK